MNSCLYDCKILHYRKSPKEHRFEHHSFMFYLDLDELDQLPDQLKRFSRNGTSWYDFRDTDHIEFVGQDVKENIIHYLREQGIVAPNLKIYLLTNVRTFGYVFNPVSFYYVFDTQGNPICVVPEVGNTFKELKPYFLGNEHREKNMFRRQVVKNYYVSPFIPLDLIMDFQLAVPDKQLNIRIDDIDKQGEKFFWATLTGSRQELTDHMLLKYTLMMPFVTLKTISLIHWHALLLWLKKVPYFQKTDHIELQQGVYRATHKDDISSTKA